MDRQVLLYRLKAITSAPRLQILTELKRRRTATVRELARLIRLSQKTTFYHLSRLVAREIVERLRKRGVVHYHLSREQHPPVRQVLALL